jgi:tetratricopeptide (TPR) repeat protein
MKTYMTFALLVLFLCPLFGQEEAEKAEIEKVIIKQIDTFYARDFDAYKELWVHEPYVVRMGSNGSRTTGWDSVGAAYENMMESTPSQKIENRKYEISDLHIQVNGNSAWAVNNQNNQFIRDGSPVSNDQWLLRGFEKSNGQWKIVYMLLGNLASSAQTFTALESEFNTLGYSLLNMDRIDEAIKTFKLNVEYFPKSSNVYDSLGEAYMKKGETELALLNYRKSVELNPNNTQATKMLKELSAK